MTEEQKVAIDNIRQAVAGKPPKAYAEVNAGDVVTAAALAREPDAVTDALSAGARGAGPGAVVYQLAWQLAHMLGKAGAA